MFTVLLAVGLPVLASLYFKFLRDGHRVSIALLALGALLLRLYMISLDPYLHEWDERFHALVARNMTDHPFTPMLFRRHYMAFNPLDWAYLHIWVHKQPLFLWQMALSMELFGVSEFSMRLPSAIMGAVMVFLVYDISRKWFRDETVGYISAFLVTFSYYILELATGRLSLDHNDLAFTFYVTCSIWAFVNYVDSKGQRKWILWIGVFAGMSILVKWLTGLLVFGGWGLYTMLSNDRLSWRKYFEILVALGIACLVFGPWQWYIMSVFPEESRIAYAYNVQHMGDNLSHPGSMFYHLEFLPTAYHPVLLALLVLGLMRVLASGKADRALSASMVAMAIVVFLFFSLFVATKMPAFVFPVAAILFSLMAYGLWFVLEGMGRFLRMPRLLGGVTAGALLVLGFYAVKYADIRDYRGEANEARNKKIHNTEIFRQLPAEVDTSYVILNTRPYENIELMFYHDYIAYHWYPTKEVLDSLKGVGIKFAAFDYVDDQQALPDYIRSDPDIMVLSARLK